MRNPISTANAQLRFSRALAGHYSTVLPARCTCQSSLTSVMRFRSDGHRTANPFSPCPERIYTHWTVFDIWLQATWKGSLLAILNPIIYIIDAFRLRIDPKKIRTRVGENLLRIDLLDIYGCLGEFRVQVAAINIRHEPWTEHSKMNFYLMHPSARWIICIPPLWRHKARLLLLIVGSNHPHQRPRHRWPPRSFQKPKDVDFWVN